MNAEWDHDAHVWGATSDNVPGLITEADTMEALAQKLTFMIPDLLEANRAIAGGTIRDILINLIAHREQLISIRD